MSQLSKFNTIIDHISVADALTDTGQQIVANALEAIAIIKLKASKTNELIQQNAEQIERLLKHRNKLNAMYGSWCQYSTILNEINSIEKEIDRLTEFNEGLHKEVADLIGEQHNWEDRVA